MAQTAIFTLTSELHDEQAVDTVTKDFLDSLGVDHLFRGSDYSDYGSYTLNLIFVRTGGTEGIFKGLFPELREKSGRPFYLLTSGKSNSLAASMEILSYLQQHGIKGEIIHGSTDYIAQRINVLERIETALKQLHGTRLGIIGEPSDWLISSHADKAQVKEQLGIELVDIPMQALLEAIEKKDEGAMDASSERVEIQQALPGAQRIYEALKDIIVDYRINGFTLRCFDLLTAVKNTGCLALAKLNAEGYVAGCEGDVPAMLSMMIVRSLLGISGFQANPSSINPETGEMVFAHCTIPLDMVEKYEYDTHFESGIGVGIRGFMKEGPVTIFKVSGDLSRHFVAEGHLVNNQSKPDLCRTQQVIKLCDKSQTGYFLKNPIGNHHIIVPGHHKELIENIL
jgi:L-fucose isomerase-like protein